MSEELWSDFVASEITPRFPHGLTIDDALGQWRDAEANEIVKEPSKELRVIVPGDIEIKEIPSWPLTRAFPAAGRRHCDAAGLRFVLISLRRH